MPRPLAFLALLLTLLVGLGPLDADAKPRDAVVAQTQIQPGADLNQILEANGWTVLGLPSNMHLPGKLFKPGASSAQGTCVDATPVTGDLPSIEAQGSKGFVVEAGASKGAVSGSASVQATSFKLKSTTDVEQPVIEGFDMKLNDKCLQELADLQAKGTSIAGWFVVQEVARARVKEVKCTSKEAAAKVRAMWIARGEVGAMSDCVESSEITGVIAYKARPVSEMLPAPAPAPTAATPAQATSSVDFGASGTGMDVAAKLRQQQCDEQAKTRGAQARANRLATAKAEVLAKARAAWTKLEPELEMCTKLKRSKRDGCIAAVNKWLSVARAMQVSIPAGIESVQTDCGERHPAYPADIQTVEAADMSRASALLTTLKLDTSPLLAEGDRYYYGDGVTQDIDRAAPLYEKACSSGEQRGCAELANILFAGRGNVREDKPRAHRLMKQAMPELDGQCRARISRGCLRQGSAFEKGIGVSQDYARAATLFQKGCDGGLAMGCRNVGVMYDQGTGVTKDVKKAVSLYKKACDYGDAGGCSNLGVMYEMGTGVTKSDSTARRYFMRACRMAPKSKACTWL